MIVLLSNVYRNVFGTVSTKFKFRNYLFFSFPILSDSKCTHIGKGKGLSDNRSSRWP